MGLASNQARLNILTLRKADLEYRLIMITNQAQNLAEEKSEEVAKKAQALETFNNDIASGKIDKDVTFDQTAAYADYETAMAELDIADTKLTQEQKAVETEHAAVVAEKEEVEKLVGNNIKDSFGYFD